MKTKKRPVHKAFIEQETCSCSQAVFNAVCHETLESGGSTHFEIEDAVSYLGIFCPDADHVL